MHLKAPEWMGLALLCVGVGCTGAVNANSGPAPSADIVLRGVTLRNYQDSTLHLTATMPRLALARVSTDLAADEVQVKLASGVELTSASVSGNANEGRIEGSNGVTLHSPSGIDGRAPSATYEKALGSKGGAHGSEGMHLAHPRFSLEASAFDLDFASEHANFTEAVTRTKGAP